MNQKPMIIFCHYSEVSRLRVTHRNLSDSSPKNVWNNNTVQEDIEVTHNTELVNQGYPVKLKHEGSQ